MSETKFTAGPWSVHPADTKAEWDVMTDEGFYIAQTFEMLGEHDRDETLANAHLIAAAPALYEALTFAVSVLMKQKLAGSIYAPVLQQARAALRLAEGESNDR